MRHLRALLPYFRPYRVTYAAGFALVLVSNFFTTLGPRYLQRGIDALGQNGDSAAVRQAVLMLLGVAVLGGIARYGMRELLNSGSRRIETDLRDNLFRHLQRLSAAFYDRYPTGDLMARATNDLLAVRMVAGPAAMYLSDTVSRSLLILPYMLHISPRLTAIALLPLAVLPVSMALFGQAVHRRTLAIQAHFGVLTNFVHENLSGVRIVRAYRQERAEVEHFRTLNEEYARRNVSLARVSGAFHPLLAMLGGLGGLAVLWVGGRLLVVSRVTPGEFVAFGVYLVVLVWPMIALGWVVNLVQRGEASMGRINAIFAEQPEVVSPAQPVALPRAEGGRALRFEGVWFRYPGAPERGWVLKDISFAVPRGGALAIVGPTGAGKSTLAELIVRSYDPDRGQILLDDIALHTLDVGALRQEVGFVPQETFLFSVPLRENILLGAPDDGRLERVAETSQLAEAIPTLPHGFDTLLGERGINLSGGQKQRAAIARALAQDPPVFVLDDALSAVDAMTEVKILRALRSALAGRTSVVISHRLAAVRDADWILVLEEGAIVEQGPHAELMARGGRYWDLLRRQQMEAELESVTAPTSTESAPPA